MKSAVVVAVADFSKGRNINSGGGTRTPDTRIMIPLLVPIS